MAFSYGFFNAQNLDRVYTAEDFTAYLSSLICNGILDTYRQCFAPTVKNLSVTFGTGKAWIDGHYFISDTLHTIDLSSYVDGRSPSFRFRVMTLVLRSSVKAVT